jgi:hypothetical protein
MRRQHFEETTAFQTSQPRGGGRHVCSIRHHDHRTRAQGKTSQDEGSASSTQPRVRRLVTWDKILGIESDCSAAWPSPNCISGLSPTPDHWSRSIVCRCYYHTVHTFRILAMREACRLPGLRVSDKELMRHTDIVTSYSSMSTFIVVVEPACRNYRQPVVKFL